MEGKMAQSQALQSQEKKELVSKDETTVPVRYFVPTTEDRGEDRSVEIRRHGTTLYRVQCWAFRPLVHAIKQDRPAADQRQSRRRCSDAEPEKGQRGDAAQNLCRLRHVLERPRTSADDPSESWWPSAIAEGVAPHAAHIDTNC